MHGKDYTLVINTQDSSVFVIPSEGVARRGIRIITTQRVDGMGRERKSYVYILLSLKGTMYVGVTSNLEGRVWQHKTGAFDGFTKKYRVDLLVYYEEFDTIEEAIFREKQIKGWRREKKEALVEASNSKLEDLSKDWFKD